MKEQKQLTELSELGEFGLIERLTKKFSVSHKETIKGVGDDAAVLKAGNEYLVVTTDMLTDGVHFNLMYSPLKHLGYKSVVVNLSDVFAMNATPKQITVSIAVSSRVSVEALDELYEGIQLACSKYNVDLIGGDTTASKSALTISVTAIGSAPAESIAYRTGAKETDLICVTGNLGAAYAGLLVLERERSVFKANPDLQPDLTSYSYVVERQLKPEARGDVVEALKVKGIVPTSMIDISDGLSSEVLHLCKASGLGCVVFEEKIPIDMETDKVAVEMNMDPTIFALNGGDDYELLFTIPVAMHEKVADIPGVSIIGYMTDASEGNYLFGRNGGSAELTAQGWDTMDKED